VDGIFEEQRRRGVRLNHVTMRFVVLATVIGIAFAGSVLAADEVGGGWAEQNVRAVQGKLRDAGLYFGEIDGAYSSELAAAIGRYQIRNGLQITGQLDEETSKALGAKPAVTTTANDRAKSSETWRRLRAGEQQMFTSAPVTSSPRSETSGTDTEIPLRSPPAATTSSTSYDTKPSAPPVTAQETSSSGVGISTQRLRDYVGAFVLAGLDPHVGSETDFFADRVEYYDEGVIGREKIRNDLKRYATRWPDRRFWLDGEIKVEPQNGNRVRVTFPLRYDLRNGGKHSSGKINKTLVLEPTGNDFEIVAVNERKSN
jgi:peptidoglycan hydrolase-like protein with peptidoglycan-binding domain